jgi:hypothetical protein
LTKFYLGKKLDKKAQALSKREEGPPIDRNKCLCQKEQIREYKYKKILRQCSILAVNFWNVTYFGVFNFSTSYLGAKIGQNKTMTKISRFTVYRHLFKLTKK